MFGRKHLVYRPKVNKIYYQNQNHVRRKQLFFMSWLKPIQTTFLKYIKTVYIY